MASEEIRSGSMPKLLVPSQRSRLSFIWCLSLKAILHFPGTARSCEFPKPRPEGQYSVLTDPSFFWLVVFGIFGKMYIREDPEGDAGIQRMKNAVWVDLVNMLLWLVSAVYGAVLFFKNKPTRSLFTGRATV